VIAPRRPPAPASKTHAGVRARLARRALTTREMTALLPSIGAGCTLRRCWRTARAVCASRPRCALFASAAAPAPLPDGPLLRSLAWGTDARGGRRRALRTSCAAGAWVGRAARSVRAHARASKMTQPSPATLGVGRWRHGGRRFTRLQRGWAPAPYNRPHVCGEDDGAAAAGAGARGAHRATGGTGKRLNARPARLTAVRARAARRPESGACQV
jgi:hypothetical protein